MAAVTHGTNAGGEVVVCALHAETMPGTGACGEPNVRPASMPLVTAPFSSTTRRESPVSSFSCPPCGHWITAPWTITIPIS